MWLKRLFAGGGVPQVYALSEEGELLSLSLGPGDHQHSCKVTKMFFSVLIGLVIRIAHDGLRVMHDLLFCERRTR